MRYYEAIQELKLECENNNKYCKCKGAECRECYIAIAIKAIKKVMDLQK